MGISWGYLGNTCVYYGIIWGISGVYLDDILGMHFWDILVISGGNLGIFGDIWGRFGGYLRYILGISGGCILVDKLGDILGM